MATSPRRGRKRVKMNFPTGYSFYGGDLEEDTRGRCEEEAHRAEEKQVKPLTEKAKEIVGIR